MTATDTIGAPAGPEPRIVGPESPGQILERVRQQDFDEFRTRTLERMERNSGVLPLLVRNTFSFIRSRDGEAAGYRSLAGMLFAYTALEELLGENLPLPPGVQAEFTQTTQFGHLIAIEGIARSESVKPSEEMFQGIFGPSHSELVRVVQEDLEHPESQIGARGIFLLYRELFTGPASVTIDTEKSEVALD